MDLYYTDDDKMNSVTNGVEFSDEHSGNSISCIISKVKIYYNMGYDKFKEYILSCQKISDSNKLNDIQEWFKYNSEFDPNEINKEYSLFFQERRLKNKNIKIKKYKNIYITY